MGKTADLTSCPKTTIDHLAQGGQRHKRVIAKESGCSQSSVSSTLIEMPKGRKRCGRKKCTSNRITAPGEDCETKPIQKCGGDSQRVECSWSQCFKNTTHRHMQDMGFSCRIPCVKPLLNTDSVRSVSTGLLLSGPKFMFSDESKFAFSFGNQGSQSLRREERHRIHVAWGSSVKFPRQWWFGVPCNLLVLVHCVFLRSKVTQPYTRKF